MGVKLTYIYSLNRKCRTAIIYPIVIHHSHSQYFPGMGHTWEIMTMMYHNGNSLFSGKGARVQIPPLPHVQKQQCMYALCDILITCMLKLNPLIGLWRD